MAGAANDASRSTSMWIAHAGDRPAIRETRLRIVPTRARETLAGLLARTHGRWSMAEAMAANCFGQRGRLAAGEPVNIALDEPYTP
jgi:hypothetical protein